MWSRRPKPTTILLLLGLSGWAPASGISFSVTGLIDGADVDPGDGICDADPSPLSTLCTLRAAVMEANALPGTDTVVLGSSTYTLTIPASGLDDDATGDLNVTDALVVRGTGSSVLDGNDQNRLFLVEAGASLVLTDTEVRDGLDDFGGCFRAFGDLTLRRVFVHHCMATDGGGAIHTNNGTLIVEDSWIHLNTAGGTGGGISSFGFTRLERTTVSSNFGGFRAGGLRFGDPDGLVLVNSTLRFNSTEGIGGGAWLTGPSYLYNVTIVDNICDTDADGGTFGGGIFQASQPVTVSNSVIALNFCDIPMVWSDCSGSYVSGGYNFVGIGTGCSGFTATGDAVGGGPASADPELEAFELSGGYAPGRLPAPGSPLIDAGDPSGCVVDRDGSGPGGPVTLTEDQRGFPRQGRCDIGALEAGADIVFADGFESGDVLEWSSSVI